MTAKQIIVEILKIKTSLIRVTRGGSTNDWLRVYTPYELLPHERLSISNRLLEEGLIGTYYTDHGINDGYAPCVLFMLLE